MVKREAYGRDPLARAAGRLLSPVHLDLGKDHRDSIFIAGSGRGGTSWLAEAVSAAGNYRYVFEPFHPGRVRAARPFGYRRYLRPADRRPYLLEPADRRPYLLEPAGRILGGRVRGLWTDRFQRGFVHRRRLIKEIRANLFLAWLARNFPGMPVVFVLRHPCAVAHSKTRLGWRSRLEEFLEQPDLVEDFLAPVADRMRAARSEFERHVFAWCIENLVPLAQLRRSQAHLVFYERLCESPEDELAQLFGYLDSGGMDRALRSLRKPSSLSRAGSEILSGGNPARGWVREVSEAEIKRATQILALFGLDGIYGESPEPDPDSAWRMLGEPWPEEPWRGA